MINRRKSDAPRIGIILDTYPSRTETFIENELIRLAGEFEMTVFAFRKEDTGRPRPDIGTAYHPGVFSPKSLASHFYVLTKHPRGYFNELGRVLKGKKLRCRLSIFIKGCYWSMEAERSGIGHLHAHFASFPASIAHFISRTTGIPYSFSAHANDIYAGNPTLAEKLNDASFAVTCTRHNLQHLRSLVPAETGSRIHLAYHGIPLSEWPFRYLRKKAGNKEISVLTVGRLVEKKGYYYMCEVIRMLRDKGKDVKWTIAGEGCEKQRILKRLEELGITDNTEFTGWVSSGKLRELYGRCDVLAQPSVIATDGDRDGIPNVIIEAMASGIPVVSSDISGIGEIINSENGILVAEKDPPAIANGILNLIEDPALRHKIIINARATAEGLGIDTTFKILKNIFHTNLIK